MADETLAVIVGTPVTGRFATVNGLGIASGEHFEINDGATAVTLEVLSGP